MIYTVGDLCGMAVTVRGPEGERMCCDLEDLRADGGRLAPGREGLTIYVRDLDRWVLRLIDSDIPIDGVRLASSYTASCQLGRVRLRDARLWCDDRPPELEQWALELGELRDRVRRVCRGNVEAQPTAAQTAHAVFRWCSGAWRHPQDWPAGFGDLVRASMYGGRLLMHHPSTGWHWEGGVVGAHRNREARRHARRLHADHYQLPPGWTLRRWDMRSAYPWAASLSLPDVWGPVDYIADGTPWRDHRHGVARASVMVGDTACVPARVRANGRTRTIWPRQGIVGGVFSFETLRLAESTGAVVTPARIEWPDLQLPARGCFAIAWTKSRPLARETIATLAAMPAGLTGWARKAANGLGQRLYGTWAASRWSLETWTVDECAEARVVPRVIVGDQAIVPVRGDVYPDRAQPAWGAAITSKVATELVQVERSIIDAGGRPLYCDTDSVLAAMPPGVDPVETGSRVGDWREDWSGQWAALMAPRRYVLSGDRIVLAGIPAESAHELWTRGQATVTLSETLQSAATTATVRLRR